MYFKYYLSLLYVLNSVHFVVTDELDMFNGQQDTQPTEINNYENFEEVPQVKTYLCQWR
jgi:hypothetical protein